LVSNTETLKRRPVKKFSIHSTVPIAPASHLTREWGQGNCDTDFTNWHELKWIQYQNNKVKIRISISEHQWSNNPGTRAKLKCRKSKRCNKFPLSDFVLLINATI
jgi:hypothetical protein